MTIKSQRWISDKTVEEDKYAKAKRERDEYADAVVHSPSTKKIVVAGPGTGKTYLFNKILEGKKNTLTLTFVNSLVEDLSLELCGLSDVRTLHGFARRVLTKAKQENIKIFPKLSKVIEEDAKILLNLDEIDFDHLFHNRDDKNIHIKFYEKRRDYYGHYGFSDIVFAAVRYFEENRQKIPLYKQVVVDEFQDFNALEVSLIDLLAKKSPVLLVGDDDQALYESLKSASPEHIRQRYSEKNFGYTAFSLPYCSRCTRVIVEAVNDIIRGATEDRYLGSRITKAFEYFQAEENDRDSDANPKLMYAQSFHNRIPWFIQERIEEIGKQVRQKFTVLVISPTKLKSQRIVKALKAKGFKNLQFVEKKHTKEPTLLDGLKLLLKDKNCNLGWRVVAKKLVKDPAFETLVKETDKGNAVKVSDLIESNTKGEVSKMLTTLRAVRDGNQADDGKLADLFNKVDVDAYRSARDDLKDEIKLCKPASSKLPLSDPAIRKIPITITTIQSSKGLEADYVFITHFDDQYFIKDKDKSKVSDEDICNFVVVLTRARKKVFLISSNTEKSPVFLDWIDTKRICQMNGMGNPAS